jgi:ribosomal protein S18 acetylase RimI-like enzyme
MFLSRRAHTGRATRPIASDANAKAVMVGHDGHRGWVYYLAVKLGNRRHGLGRRMMQEAEAWLRERGVMKLNLMVRDGNAEALGFYQQLGYEDAHATVLARWLVDSA